jgi:hypothetical protein
MRVKLSEFGFVRCSTSDNFADFTVRLFSDCLERRDRVFADGNTDLVCNPVQELNVPTAESRRCLFKRLGTRHSTEHDRTT